METIAQRYQRLRTAFAEKIAAVPAERWDSPSPCEGWSARDVVSHVVDTQALIEGSVNRTLHPGPPVEENPLGAFMTATDQVQAHLEDPEAAGAEYDGLFGRTTFESTVDSFLGFDLVVHGWDLARAAGLDETIQPADIARIGSDVERLGDNLRKSGACGPALDVAADASEQDKLLASLGRQP